MDKIVKRVTLINRHGAETEAVRVYRDSEKKKRKVSALIAPFERVARKLMESGVVFGQETVRRSNRANRRKRNGFIFDATVIVVKSGRAAYNKARKADPLGLLPKA